MLENEIIKTEETEQESEALIVDVDETEVIGIEVDEVFVSLNGGGQQFNHSLLDNRETPNQHPIIAIEGLREELDKIESLQTIYSDKRQQADYYMWRNDRQHPLPENPYGLFVSIYDDTDHIQVCDGSTDVFGVTVDSAAFVGYQEYVESEGGAKYGRDGTYCPVVCYGSASVRRESTVAVGDYVVPNMRGEAKKSNGNYGYLVTALAEKYGVLYAVISLKSPSTIAKTISDGVEDLTERMQDAEFNIASAINVANAAYAASLAAKDKADNNSKYTEGQISSALGQIGDMNKEINTLFHSMDMTKTDLEMAKQIAYDAVNAAELIKKDAVSTANSADAKINELIDAYEPLQTWIDPDTGKINSLYIIDYMDKNGLATKNEIAAVEDKTQEAFSAIEQNATNIQSLLSSISKYSVGLYSQAYGLTHEQAKSILEVGMVYVPTEQYDGLYIKNNNGENVKQFLVGYYYTWNGEYWVQSDNMAVAFSNQYVVGTASIPYWVVTIGNVAQDDVVYELGGLYFWDEDRDNWEKVASLEVNIMSRVVSAIRQTSNNITASVTDIAGSVSGLELKIDKAESSVTTLASRVLGQYESITKWDETGKDTGTIYFVSEDSMYRYWDGTQWQKTDNATTAGLPGTLAAIEQKANDNGASIAMVVSGTGDGKKINAASIVTAIKNDESSISLLSDHINLKGKVTFESFDDDTKQKIEADIIDVQIWSSRGNIFKSTDVSTILTCHVFSGGVDITDKVPPEAFTWIKINDDGTTDEQWQANPYDSHTNIIQISPSDIWSRAVFTCKVEFNIKDLMEE